MTKHNPSKRNPPHYTTPPAVLLAGGAVRKREHSAPVPAAAEIELLLHFFSKKWQVQGSALPPPAQGLPRFFGKNS